jgi:hypothetical protein
MQTQASQVIILSAYVTSQRSESLHMCCLVWGREPQKTNRARGTRTSGKQIFYYWVSALITSLSGPYFSSWFSHVHTSVTFHSSSSKLRVLHARIKLLNFILDAFARSRRATVSFVIFVCPHGTAWLPLGGFWLNLIFEYFSESISRKFKFD